MARQILLTLLALGLTGAARAEELVRARYTMGTLLRVSLEGPDRAALDRAAAAVFAEVEKWDRLLSTYKPESDISRVNGSAPEWTAVSPETIRAAAAALGWARWTGGAFDPTVEPLMRRPGAPLELVGHGQVEISTAAVRLRKKGMGLDFGGIGKGWALDRALEQAMRESPVEEIVMDFGGQLLFWSRRPKSWPAAIRNVSGTEFLVRSPGSLGTSSLSERGKHILDPATGRPAEGCESVTVWARTAEEADALDTALFVMGPRVGLKFAEDRGVAAHIVYRGGKQGLIEASSTEWRKEFGVDRSGR